MVDIYVLLVIFGVSLCLGGVLAGAVYLLKAACDWIREELKIKDMKEAMKDIVKVEKEDHLISPKFLKSLVATEFDKRYEAEKRRAKLEAEMDAMEETDILFKRSAE